MGERQGYLSTVATVHGELRAGAVTRCQLVVVEGPDMGRALALGKQEQIVGTDDTCALVLHDDRVSSRHAAFRLAEGGIAVRDLGSRNGQLAQAAAKPDEHQPQQRRERTLSATVRSQIDDQRNDSLIRWTSLWARLDGIIGIRSPWLVGKGGLATNNAPLSASLLSFAKTSRKDDPRCLENVE